MKRLRISLAVQVALCFPVGVSHAGELRTELEYLRDTHPLIRANQHALNASNARRYAAMAGFLPKLTLSGDRGPEDINSTAFKTTEPGEPRSNDPGEPVLTELDRKKFNIALEQNLFNGGKTLVEVSISGLDRSIKESEFQSTSQDVLLEAVIAYLQVLRNRLLIRLAELNEQTTLEQLSMETSRVQRGGGVVVDELQAATRLQIVRERRVFYEQGMRDAVTTYEQVFGRPPDASRLQDLDSHMDIMPADVEAALEQGALTNPKLRQIKLQIERANKLILLEGSSFLPKIDFVLSKSRDDKVAGLYKKSEDSALIKFSWNIFSGGDSVNRTRATVSDMREIGEREISTQRKTAESIRMSWNQYQKGLERLKLLEEASASSRRVMEGRKRLRDSGRETVLAVLDAEVEYYGVLANKVNAMIDARLGSYRLLHSIGLLQFDALNLETGDFRLPVRPIDQTLRQLVEQTAPVALPEPPTASSSSAPESVKSDLPPATIAEAPAPAVVETPTVAAVAAEPADPVQAVTSLVEQWAQAWSSKDFAAYGGFYGEQFKTGQFRTKRAWLNFRKPRILGRSAIAVSVEELQVKMLEPGVAEVGFVQTYESGTVKDRSIKKMGVVQTADGWRIVSEESSPIPKSLQVPDAAPAPIAVAADSQLAEASPSATEDHTAVVSELLLKWAAAWSSKDFDTYANFYGEQFKTGPYRSKAAWLTFRQPRITSNDDIQVTVDNVVVKVQPTGQLDVTFVQRYTSKALKIRSVKKMILAKTGDEWKIVSERD